MARKPIVDQLVTQAVAQRKAHIDNMAKAGRTVSCETCGTWGHIHIGADREEFDCPVCEGTGFCYPMVPCYNCPSASPGPGYYVEYVKGVRYVKPCDKCHGTGLTGKNFNEVITKLPEELSFEQVKESLASLLKLENERLALLKFVQERLT